MGPRRRPVRVSADRAVTLRQMRMTLRRTRSLVRVGDARFRRRPRTGTRVGDAGASTARRPISGHLRRHLPGQRGRSGAVLAGRGDPDRLDRATEHRARRVPAAVLPLVPRRRVERLPQRPGPARRGRPRGAAGVDLRLAGHRDDPALHLHRAARRGRPLRRGAGRAGRRARRPGGDLPADGARGRGGHAGLRSDRRRALGGLRRLRPQGARRPDRRRDPEGDRLGVLRHRGGAGDRVQATAGPGARAGHAQAGGHRHPAAPAGRGGHG
jgi:hypothetical protein